MTKPFSIAQKLRILVEHGAVVLEREELKPLHHLLWVSPSANGQPASSRAAQVGPSDLSTPGASNMLKRNLKSADREWQLRCNACREKHAFPGATAFTRIVEWLRNNGWKARTHSQIWEHICPKCQQAQLDDRYLERLHA